MNKDTPRFTGFATLKNTSDLLMKLQHDIARMTNDQSDEYAAFDFFVTAEHMVDWHLPGNPAAQRALRQSEVLLQVVSHIANGAKHFSATAKQHKSVLAVSRETYEEESGDFEEDLEVHLSKEEALALEGSSFKTTTLAFRVYAYWRDKLGG
jgi:hypothetical protein